MRGSKKRKHPSASSFSAPFSGASTLSNPRVHVRRSYVPRPHPLNQPPPQPALQAENRLDSDGRMFPPLSVKDLRARRVFSPSSPIVASDDKGGHSECSDDVRSLKNAEMDQVSHGNEILETKPNAETPKQVESTVSGEVPNGVRNADMCGMEQNGVRDGDLCIQSTLPNEALGNPEADCSWNRKSSVHVSKNLSNGRRNCVSNTKSVLKPFSRLKVFKVPNSLNYKRMLPYLMAVANESSCAQEIEKGSELDPTVQSSGSQCEKILGNKSEADGFPTVQASVLTPIKGSGHDNEPALVSPKGIAVSQVSLSQKSCASQVEQCKPVQVVGNMIPIPETNLPVIPTSTPGHAQTSLVQATCNVSSFHETDLDPETSLVPAHSNMKPIHETYVHPETSPVKGLSNMSQIHEAYLSTVTRSSCHLGSPGREGNVDVEKRCLTSATNEISTDAPCLGQGCSVAEMAVQLELPTARISTSVFKRNPRCCRGLCTCLTCASFRLHAERAFEFSKNQMQDAEEIALGLIRELSNLRNVLHNSACGANASLQASEVKNACRKASVAEELAKSRLVEMNDNLNHHCKIT